MTNHNNAAQAIQEAERIAAADEYFKARAWLMDTNDNRRIFEAGFDRAYALLSKLRAPVAGEREAVTAADPIYEIQDDDSAFIWHEVDKARYDTASSYEERRVVYLAPSEASAPVAGEALLTDDEMVAAFKDANRRARDQGLTAAGPHEYVAAGACALRAKYAAPQASEAVRSEQDVSGRTPTDYALEFAEYLARDAEYAIACLNASQRANEALLDLTEEVASSEAYQAAEEAAAEADEAFTEAITGLRSAAFEFRKRRDRAALSAQPRAQRTGGNE